jgi:hypothetical protein
MQPENCYLGPRPCLLMIGLFPGEILKIYEFKNYISNVYHILKKIKNILWPS